MTSNMVGFKEGTEPLKFGSLHEKKLYIAKITEERLNNENINDGLPRLIRYYKSIGKSKAYIDWLRDLYNINAKLHNSVSRKKFKLLHIDKPIGEDDD